MWLETNHANQYTLIVTWKDCKDVLESHFSKLLTAPVSAFSSLLEAREFSFKSEEVHCIHVLESNKKARIH
jgi:hypothetical protein